MHIDGNNRGALFGRQSHQCLSDDDRRLDIGCPICYGKALISEHTDSKTVAAHAVSAGIDNDTVQPAAYRGVMSKRAGAAMGRQHGFLKGIVGVFGGMAASPGQPIQLDAMPAKEFLEGAPVTGDMCAEEIGITAVIGGEAGHGRTVTSRARPGTSPLCSVSPRRGR